MKILLVIAVLLVLIISIFFIDNFFLKEEAVKTRREEILNPRIYKPKSRVVSFANDIEARVCPKTAVEPILETATGGQDLLKMGPFINRFYSQKDLTNAKAIYEAEALSIWNRYRMEEWKYKKDHERYHLPMPRV